MLNEKPADFEVFLQKLEQQSYEVKREKHTSVKGTRQKRFIRFRTLGTGYSEDEIKAVIAGEAEHRPHQKQPPKEQPFHLLVDIQATSVLPILQKAHLYLVLKLKNRLSLILNAKWKSLIKYLGQTVWPKYLPMRNPCKNGK